MSAGGLKRWASASYLHAFSFGLLLLACLARGKEVELTGWLFVGVVLRTPQGAGAGHQAAAPGVWLRTSNGDLLELATGSVNPLSLARELGAGSLVAVRGRSAAVTRPSQQPKASPGVSARSAAQGPKASGSGADEEAPQIIVDDLSPVAEDGSVLGGMATRAGSDGSGQEAPVSQVPTTDLRILFLIVRFCEAVDRGPSITPQALDAMLFGDGSDTPHLQGYFEHCSNGRSVLSRSNVRILDGIRVPCNGTLGDGGGTLYGPRRWRTSSCAFEDTFAWGELAAGQARQRLGDAEFERFHHVVLLQPSGWKSQADPMCKDVYGVGEVGIGRRTAAGGPGYALTAVSDDKVTTLSIYMHELLHNLGLWHAADATACPYCDWTCVMGWCCANRCPNAPHLRMLGWADPVAGGGLALGSLPEGRLTTLRLPLQHAVGGSLAVVDATAGTGKGLQFFLSYRNTEPPYDDVVGTDGRYSHVQLHQRYVGDIPTPGEGMDTMQLARFARAGLTWQDPATRLAVGIAYVGANDAGVVVCRAAALPGGAPNWSSCDTSLYTLSLLGGRMQSGLPATTPITTAAPRPPSPTPPRPGAKNSQRAPNLPPFYLEDPSPKQSPALAAKPPKAGRRNSPPPPRSPSSRLPPPPSPPPPLAAAGKPPRKRRNGAARSATAGPDSGAVPSLRLRTSSRRHLRALLPSS